MPVQDRHVGLRLREAIPNILNELQPLVSRQLEDLLEKRRGGHWEKLCYPSSGDKSLLQA